MKNWLKYLLLPILVIAVGVTGYFVGQKNRAIYLIGSDNMTALDKLEATLDLVEKYYVDSVDQEYLVQDMIPLLMSELDPHSSYLTAEERAIEAEQMQGEFSGIGVTFNYLLDTIVILDVLPGGPSDMAGIKAGERITRVDGISLENLDITPDSVRNRLKGINGSFVNLTLRDPLKGTFREVAVKRGAVNVSTVSASYLRPDSLGVIHLSSFGTNTYSDFMNAFAQLQVAGAKGLILDLRGNPGGILESALKLCNEILPNGSLIMYMEGKSVPRQDFKSDGTGALINLPLYVMIDEFSASASEVVTGALQDNDVAIVLGRRSFGKGLVQRLYEYKDGSSIHLTIARYYTPSGRSIQRNYKLGDGQSYNNDWIERVMSGELYNKDSITFDSDLLFHTVAGRPVYGGGGIMPDIFIPQDSTKVNSYLRQVVDKGVVTEYAFRYADRYRPILHRIKSTDEAISFLKRQNLVWKMARFANEKHGIRIKNYLVYEAHSRLEQMLFSSILSYSYGAEKMAEYVDSNDQVVGSIAELFKHGVYSPLDIPRDRVLLNDSIVRKMDADSVFATTIVPEPSNVF